jgi:hypothetical protein
MSGSLLKFVFTLAALLSAATLSAHNAPGSAVLLDVQSDSVQAELRLPLSELELAFHHSLEAEPDAVVARYASPLAEYIGQHVAISSQDGRAWSVKVRTLHVAANEQPMDLIAQLELRPPPGAPLHRFSLHYDAISHEVMNHIILVSVRSDWRNALLGDRPELLGALRSFNRDLEINREAGSAWRGFHSILTLGMRHIGEGTDHLLFLFVLLLPAPLLAAGRRWGTYGGYRYSVVGLLRIVTAFTVGHSITLFLGTMGWLRLPSQPVEVLIAVSILVSAVHAVRPLFAGREPWVAGAFGLVHGLAFATVLAGFHLDRWHLAAALFAFNLGIELAQLAFVAAAVPLVLFLARTRFSSWSRLCGAAVSACAATVWIWQRW